jgi:two-component system LytT family sensor kinase
MLYNPLNLSYHFMTVEINRKRVGKHLLFWMVFGCYAVLDFSWDMRSSYDWRMALPLLTQIPVTIIMVYINLYVLMPRFFYTKRYVAYGFVLTLLMLGVELICQTANVTVWMPWMMAHHVPGVTQEDLIFLRPICIFQATTQFYPVVALTMLFKLRNNAFDNEKKLRELEHEKFNAELHSLKAQLHPHFFFNTLNSIYSLSLKKSERSPGIVLRLSELMRYMLYEANASSVLLTDDLSHLTNYIGIEQTRFADRLDLSFQYSGDLDKKTITPLLLLPFVENAFKHGLVNELDKAWITIDLKVVGSQLYFKTANSYPGCDIAGNCKGVGLKNVRRRLTLAYPDRYELNIIEQDHVYSVDLKLQLYEQDQMRHSG